MLHSQVFEPSWPDYSFIELNPYDSYLHDVGDMEVQLGPCEFSASLTTTEDSSDISPIPYVSTVYSDDLQFQNIALPDFRDDAYFQVADREIQSGACEFSSFLTTEDSSDSDSSMIPYLSTVYSDELQLKSIELPTSSNSVQAMFVSEEFRQRPESGPIPNGPFGNERIDGAPQLPEENSGCLLLEQEFYDEEREGAIAKLVLPGEDMELDSELSILHLLKAYGEAMEKESLELAEEILKRISQKVSPVGSTMERLGYYLFQGSDEQSEHLKQESRKNYDASFRAVYDICPYGRFAHFAANTAILEAIPIDTDAIHIVDFDMCEGVQWPPLLESLGQEQMVRITSIRRKEDRDSDHLSKFKDTKRRLCGYAQSLGLMLIVDEMGLEELLIEKKKMKRREWMVFNCMVNLPHMGVRRNGRHLLEFMRVAKELTTTLTSFNSDRGIVTFGDGHGLKKRNGEYSGFGSFFARFLLHSHALFESLEWHFPKNFSLARTAIECLFMAPCVSSLACFAKWRERGQEIGLDFKGLQLSEENLEEAKEMVRESSYEVKVVGENRNVMLLEWRGTPLVTVSAWRLGEI